MREQQQQARGGRATGIAGRGVLAAVLVTVAAAIPATPGWASAAGTAGPVSASAARAGGNDRAASRSRREAHHARERRLLRAALKRNPRGALRGSFLRRAAVAGFKMPVTVRLRPGTRLGVTLAPTRFPLDGSLFTPPAAEQELELSGSFPMIIDFQAGPGYGGFGNLQARSGPGGTITAPGPLVMAEQAGCPGASPAFVEAATSTTAGAPFVATPATQTWVDLNPFSGASDGYLDLKMSVRSRVLGFGASCATPGPVADYDVPVSPSSADPWNAPVRIRWAGSFRIAPAITADGSIRFGKISVDAAVQPQDATTGNLWGCATEDAITGAGLPLGTPCTSADGSPLVGETVSPAPFAAALSVKRLSADIVLGDRP